MGDNLVHLNCSDRCWSGGVIKCFLAVAAAVEAAARATCKNTGDCESEHGYGPPGESRYKRGADEAGKISGGVEC